MATRPQRSLVHKQRRGRQKHALAWGPRGTKPRPQFHRWLKAQTRPRRVRSARPSCGYPSPSTLAADVTTQEIDLAVWNEEARRQRVLEIRAKTAVSKTRGLINKCLFWSKPCRIHAPFELVSISKRCCDPLLRYPLLSSTSLSLAHSLSLSLLPAPHYLSISHSRPLFLLPSLVQRRGWCPTLSGSGTTPASRSSGSRSRAASSTPTSRTMASPARIGSHVMIMLCQTIRDYLTLTYITLCMTCIMFV